MLNVEQITSRLAQMPDPMLQKYAAMNKNDPYIMALAVSESNRRKQMRQAAQGAQGQMPQPKVVDAAVQDMAAPMPEDQGIARLPAGPMNFADGGIVAFADGGDVERYNKDGLIPPSAGTEYAIPGMMLPATPFMPQAGTGPSETPWLRRQWEEFSAGQRQKRIAEVEAKIAAGDKSPETKAYLDSLKAAETPPAAPQTEVSQSAGATNRGLLNRTEQRMFPSAYATPGSNIAAPKTDTTQRAPSASPSTPTAPSTGGIESIFKRLQGPMEKELTAVNTQRKTFAKSLQDFAKQEEADFEAAEAKRGDVFKGREERIAKREGELGEMKGQNLGLALLQAGAAMMSTPGSLGMALGKGVDVGTKQYAAGIDKLNAAQDRLMDARDRLEELRTNREDMTAKERRALKSSINRSVLEGEKLFLDGAEKDLGYRREDMKTLFSGLVTDMASQRSAAATAAAAARTPAEIQLIERIAAEKKIPFSQAYQEVASMKREPVSRAEALKNWTTNQASIMAQNPSIKTFEDYYALQAGAGGGTGGFKYLGVSQ